MTCHGLPTDDSIARPQLEVATTVSTPASSTALLVVDMQRDFVYPDGALHVEAASETVQPIAELITLARAHAIPVVYTRDTHTEDDREFDIWPRHCIQGTEGHQIIDELAPQPDDLIVDKNRYDAFYGTPLDHHLSHVRNIETLLIVGTVANICVGQTAASAGLRWYRVITPADCLSALTPFDQASALRQIDSLYNGTVVADASAIQFERN